MLPNNFRTLGESRNTNRRRALWYFESFAEYFGARKIPDAAKAFPVLAGMIDAHVRYALQHPMSIRDGLLYAGVLPGASAHVDGCKVGDWVVTPRTGKTRGDQRAMINAPETMAGFAACLQPADAYEKLRQSEAKHLGSGMRIAIAASTSSIRRVSGMMRPFAQSGFCRFFASEPAPAEHKRAVIGCCARHLLTSHGFA